MNTTITYFEDMNLQIFATQVTTQDTMSAEMKTFYDMTLLDEAQAELVHDQFGQKRNIPANGGKTIEFRKFGALNKATTALTEGVTPAGNSLSVSSITATVAQYGDYIVQSDILELTALDNTILEATKLLGRQAGLTLDTLTRNVLHTGTNVNYASKWSGTTETTVSERANLDSTAVIKCDTINQVVAKLRKCNAPKIGKGYVAIIHPYAAYDLMTDKAWVDAHQYTNPENLYAGEIGEIGGVRFVESSEAKVYAPEKIGGKSKLTVKTAISSSTTSVQVNEVLETATGLSIDCWAGGVANKITAITNNTTYSTLTVETAITSLAAGAVVCGKGGTKDGLTVFGTIVLAEGAYGTTEVAGGGLQTIVKQKGSAGTADPIDQRSSIGWKAIKTAEILNNDYLVRVESVSSRFSDGLEAN